MEIRFSPELTAVIREKKKEYLALEIAETENSDLNVQEFHIHFVSPRDAAILMEKKNFRCIETPEIKVLFPNYRLEYDSEIEFYYKKYLFIRLIKCRGVRF